MDNLQLREKQEEVQKLEQKMADLEQQLGGLDPNRLEQQRQKLLQEDDKLNRDVGGFCFSCQ